MSAEFEARLQKAIDDRVLPNVVLLARDKSGKINYNLSLGPLTLDPSIPSPPPITPSSTFVLASMTKLLTSIAALQLIDRNLLTLDTDITPHLPVLASQPILTSITNDNPNLTPRSRPIFLRHLLTHSSGTPYIFLSPLLQHHARLTGRELPGPLSPAGGTTVHNRFGYPLTFPPGQGYVYGSGLDWAGRLIENLTGQELEEYIYENVLRPVGVGKGGLTFHPGRYDGGEREYVGMAKRDGETGKVGYYGKGGKEIVREVTAGDGGVGEREACGGDGMYGALGEYMKVLYSVLVDDGKLLKPETAGLLFEPLLKDQPESKKALGKMMETPEWMVGFAPEVKYDHGAGGLLTDEDDHPYRKRGFLQWGGAYNQSWFIDRAAGVCGIFGTQVAPPCDTTVTPFMKEFEEEVYAML